MKELIKTEDIRNLQGKDSLKNEILRLIQTKVIKTYNIEELK